MTKIPMTARGCFILICYDCITIMSFFELFVVFFIPETFLIYRLDN